MDHLLVLLHVRALEVSYSRVSFQMLVWNTPSRAYDARLQYILSLQVDAFLHRDHKLICLYRTMLL